MKIRKEQSKMEDMKICQSCGMQMSKAEEFGTEANGSANHEYCCYCYQNGAFEDENMSLEEMIEASAPYAVEAGEAKSLDEARTLLKEYLPTLKRWAKA